MPHGYPCAHRSGPPDRRQLRSPRRIDGDEYGCHAAHWGPRGEPRDLDYRGPVVTGTTHTNDAAAIQAQVDLTAAYVDAAGRPGATPLPADISGLTLGPGVYAASSSLLITSANLTLDDGGDPNATWIFQIGSTLTVNTGADVILSGGCGSAANVFWQVGSSATLGVGSDFVGTIMADQSITVGTGDIVDGRLLARIAAVTLDTDQVTVP